MKNFFKAYYYFGQSGTQKFLRQKKPIYCLGSGKFCFEFLESNSYLNVAGIITDDECEPRNTKMSHQVHSINQLSLIPDGSIILVLTTSKTLIKKAKFYTKKFSFISIPLFSPRMFEISVTDSTLQTLFRSKFLTPLNTESESDLSSNLFMYTGDSQQLDELIYSSLDNLPQSQLFPIFHDIKIILKSHQGLFNELPVFTDFYHNHLLSHPADKSCPFLTIYDQLIWRRKSTRPIHDVISKFFELYSPNDIGPKSYSPESFIRFFTSHELGLPLDLLRKWARLAVADDLLDALEFKTKVKNDECVFIFRSWFKYHPDRLDEMRAKLQVTTNARIAKFSLLDGSQSENLERFTRGGFWDDYGSGGGQPYAFVHFYFDRPLDTQLLKEEMRELCRLNSGQYVNPIHSSDDLLEAQHILNILGEEL